MERRDLSLTSRVEGVRDPLPSCVVHFELTEIKSHFDQSLLEIQNQFNIADELHTAGKVEDCKNIWRSQVVFLEGILDFYLHELSKYALFSFDNRNITKSNNFFVCFLRFRSNIAVF